MSEAEPVTVVIPCRNEAGSLPGVLAAIPSGYQVLVVDNGSDDGTASVATAHGAQVVVEPTPGYGAAVMAGVDVEERPVTYRPRTAGSSKVSGSMWGSAVATWDFMKVIR